MLCLADWVLRYTRHFFGPSDTELALPNECSACVVADFPLDSPDVFTVSIIINRLRYIIESCQSFQTVLFSSLRNISLQILRIVGQVWNEGSRMLCQWLP